MAYWRTDNPPYYISAYSLAQKAGFKGTLEEWLDSLTAYGLAKQQGFDGSLDDWLKSLIGPKGDRGKSAYEYAQEGGYTGTEEEFRDRQANSGKSAYEYAREGGYTGSIEDFQKKLATECLPLAGGKMAGAIDMNGKGIANVADPANEKDAVNKAYADQIKTYAQNVNTDLTNHRHAGQSITPASIELTPSANAGHGGYVDFHYNADASDYTSRIWEDEKGVLRRESMGSNLGILPGVWYSSVTATAAGWANGSQTIKADGVIADTEKCHVMVQPLESTREAYLEAGLRCTTQGAGTVTFTCQTVPKVNIHMGVLVLRL